MRADLSAVFERDPACHSYVDAFLFYKGFHALESYRIAHWLWSEGRKAMALFLQSRISQLFAVDIHPAARIGRGIMLDHATGIVIGETAVVEDDVSIMQDVTLGGTGKESGDRHPKIRRGVLLSLGAKILGNIEVGEYSRVGAGSVVLKSVPPRLHRGGRARQAGQLRLRRTAVAGDGPLSSKNCPTIQADPPMLSMSAVLLTMVMRHASSSRPSMRNWP